MKTGKHYRAFDILGALKNNFSLKNTFFNQLQQNILTLVDLWRYKLYISFYIISTSASCNTIINMITSKQYICYIIETDK